MENSRDSRSMNHLVISYVPLLWPNPNINEQSIDDIQNRIEELPNGEATGCIWLIENEKLVPVMIFERAKEIVEHFRFWSEDKPEKWFEFKWAKNGDEYAFGLFPNVYMTIERFKIAFQLRTGYPMPTECTTSVVFKPLFLRSSRKGINFPNEKILVKIIDINDVNKDDFSKSHLDRAYTLGSFRIEPDSKIVKDMFLDD